MFFNRKSRRVAQKAGGVEFAGRWWPWGEVTRHFLFMGGSGMGKTFASNMLIRALMRAGCPILSVCVKVDDFERLHRLAEEAGQAHRVAEITPRNTGMNLLEALLRPDGDTTTAAELAGKVGEVGERSTSGGDNQFWVTHGKRATKAGIAVVRSVTGGVTIPLVHECILTAPESLEEVARNPEWNTDFAESYPHPRTGEPVALKRRLCARLVMEGKRRGLDATDLGFRNAAQYLTQELPGGGDKMRGGIIANVNNCLGHFLDPPWVGALSAGTTLNPAMIEDRGLIGILNYPMMEHFTPARMWAFAWTMEAQRHCMRRAYDRSRPPFILLRDEVAWVVNPSWDANVCIVARSQGLGHVDLVQDESTLLMGLGGLEARAEARSFVANHTGGRLLFGTTEPETAKNFSALVGQRKEVMVSGGGGGGKTGDFYADMLGASPPSWSLQYQPIVRPEEFARSPVGVALLHAGGRAEWVDFRGSQ